MIGPVLVVVAGPVHVGFVPIASLRLLTLLSG
jgi:hypothetical protein